MPAYDAMHMQNIYADDLVASTGLNDYLASFIESMQGSPGFRKRALKADLGGEGQIPVPNPHNWMTKYDAPSLRLRLKKWLELGYMFYVDPRMFELITAASESMPQEEVVPRDLPTDFGFMWIPGGLGAIDVRGQALKYHAVQWAAVGGTVYVAWLTDKNDPTDSTNIQMRKTLSEKQFMEFPRLAPSAFTDMEFGKPLPISPGPDFLVPPEMRLDVRSIDNPDGSTSMAWSWPEGFTGEELQEKMQIGVRTDPALRWLLTCWRMMQQSVASVTEEKAPRQLRKQLEKQNLPTKVTVVALRHKKPSGEGDSDIEWSHRWLVRGHWRNQKVKEDGEWTTRLIWIHPHIKGPEDKPLLIREHIYALVR